MSEPAESGSIIVASNELNYRTFKEDESWTSLQSTILAGQLSTQNAEEAEEAEESGNKLATVEEEGSAMRDREEVNKLEAPMNSVQKENPVVEDNVQQKNAAERNSAQKEDPDAMVREELDELEMLDVEDSNVLNMNLDAINGDDEVFFDCPTYSSPMPPSMRSRDMLLSEKNSQQLLTSATVSSTYNSSSTDSGYVMEDERTGALLAQMLEDFIELKSHAQFSTPKPDQEQSTVNISELSLSPNLKKKLFFAVPKSPGPVAYKRKTPRPKRPRPRVSEIREFFENVSRRNDHSGRMSMEKKSALPKKLGSKTLRNPSQHTLETLKLLKNSKSIKLIYSSHGTASFLLRNQPKPRPSSCSDMSTDLKSSNSSSCNNGQSSLAPPSIASNKSRSFEDLSTVHSSKLMHALNSNKITARQYLRRNQHSNLRNESPKIVDQKPKGLIMKRKSPKNVDQKPKSQIMKRKSLGLVSTPVKPVRELRRIFSPTIMLNVNETKKVSKSVASIVNKTRKISAKSPNTFPKIVINKE